MSKILLVEDNEVNRDMLVRRLQRRGYHALTAANGEEACRMAHDALPALILMDMHLPLLDGWEATRRIKSNPITAKIPIIALTADAMSGDREKALQCGCDEYETKPIDFPALIEKIIRLLPQKEAV